MVAGGGTGGHVFPGIALAEAFLEAVPGGRVFFVGTRAGLEARAVPARGFEIDFVPSGQVRGRGARALGGIARMTAGLWRAAAVLGRRRPHFVVGVGGYASVPVALAAWASGTPLFLQEQNAVPGRANRLLGRGARRVFAGFEGAAAWFPAGRVTVTGNPVRRAVVEQAEAARRAAPPPPPFTVLALGGSQGARAINALSLALARRVARTGLPWRFLLQTGAAEHEAVREAVAREGLPVEPFPFAEEIGEIFARCHAVLMRAGAVSLAEAALFGRPCVLIPYPFAADRHQEGNAREFCAAGGGVWLRQEEATEEAVFPLLARLEGDPAARRAAAEGCARFARPGAARAIVLSVLREIGAAPEAGDV